MLRGRCIRKIDNRKRLTPRFSSGKSRFSVDPLLDGEKADATGEITVMHTIKERLGTS